MVQFRCIVSCVFLFFRAARPLPVGAGEPDFYYAGKAGVDHVWKNQTLWI